MVDSPPYLLAVFVASDLDAAKKAFRQVLLALLGANPYFKSLDEP